MKIYFDDVFVPEDYYMSYTDNFSSFEDTFYLGSSSSLKATTLFFSSRQKTYIKLQIPYK